VSKKNYGIIEHTADIGISVTSGDLKGLFKGAALSMFDIIAQKKDRAGSFAGKKTLQISLSADDKEELFVNWLNELLLLSATRGLIFNDLRINKLNENTIEAKAVGLDSGGFEFKKEIKAATYHGLRIEKKGKRFYAEVIFDV
jgi:SHS2 domain-containing protein